MAENTKAYMVATVAGRPVVRVPAEWDDVQVAAFVAEGFGRRPNTKAHLVLPFTDDFARHIENIEVLTTRVAKRVEGNRHATNAVLALVDLGGIQALAAFEVYQMTGEEIATMYKRVCRSDVKVFHQALVDGSIIETLEVLRKRE